MHPLLDSTLILDIVFLVFWSICFIYSLLSIILGVRDREYIYFIIIVGAYLAWLVLESDVVGLEGRLYIGVADFIITLMPVAIICFIKSFCRTTHFPFFKSLAVAWVGLSIYGIVAGYIYPSLYGSFDMLWAGLATATTAVAGFVVLSAYRDGLYEAITLIIGMALLFIAMVLKAAQYVELIGGLPYIDRFGFTLFIILMECGFMTRFVLYYKEVRQMSDRILKAEENERKRLSRDLHDSVGQNLLALKLRLQIEQSRTEDQRLQRFYGEMITELGRTVEELRAIAMDLRPSFVQSQSLEQVIKTYSHWIADRTSIKISVKNGVGCLDVKEDVKDHLYRIFQEAINNVLKHAEADRVEVSVDKRDGTLYLSVSDNGKGFVPANCYDSKGLGISTMQERAKLLGGRCLVLSSPGCGTTVKVEVPLQ